MNTARPNAAAATSTARHRCPRWCNADIGSEPPSPPWSRITSAAYVARTTTDPEFDETVSAATSCTRAIAVFAEPIPIGVTDASLEMLGPTVLPVACWLPVACASLRLPPRWWLHAAMACMVRTPSTSASASSMRCTRHCPARPICTPATIAAIDGAPVALAAPAPWTASGPGVARALAWRRADPATTSTEQIIRWKRGSARDGVRVVGHRDVSRARHPNMPCRQQDCESPSRLASDQQHVPRPARASTPCARSATRSIPASRPCSPSLCRPVDDGPAAEVARLGRRPPAVALQMCERA